MQNLARRDNVVDINLWVSEKRKPRRTAARTRERRSRRRFKLGARVLPFRIPRKGEDETDGRHRVAWPSPDLPEAS